MYIRTLIYQALYLYIFNLKHIANSNTSSYINFITIVHFTGLC